jgi:hypothetical protein
MHIIYKLAYQTIENIEEEGLWSQMVFVQQELPKPYKQQSFFV